MRSVHFSLRLADIGEATQLSRLMTETFVAAYGHVAPPESLARHIERSYSAPVIHDLIDQGRIEVWVVDAVDAGASAPVAAGYIQIGLAVSAPPQLAGLRTHEVQRCYMRPEYIGCGGAELLIGKAQQRATELGTGALHLSVYQLAPRAVRFYEKHGFRATAAIKYYIDDVEFDDWLMVWQPDPSTRGLS